LFHNVTAAVAEGYAILDALVVFVFHLMVVLIWLLASVQIIDWKTHLQSDLICIDWDVKPYLLAEGSMSLYNQFAVTLWLVTHHLSSLFLTVQCVQVLCHLPSIFTNV